MSGTETLLAGAESAGGGDAAAAAADAAAKAASAAAGGDKAAADAKAATDKATADKVAADAKAARDAELAKMSPEERTKAEAADKAAKDAADKAKQGAPEKYEPFKMPEGVKLDEELLTELQGVAKKLNLTQEQAQAVADLGAKQAAKFQSAFDKQAEATIAQWTKDSKADKEFGGEKFDENLGVAKEGLKTHATPELKKLLNETGLGNHPEVLRHFFRLGKPLMQDKTLQGRAAADASAKAQAFYPNSQHNP